MNASLATTYSRLIHEQLERIQKINQPILAEVAPKIGASLAQGGVFHTFGSGHSDILARELVGRSGGLLPVSAIPDPTAGVVENLVGYGHALAERYDRQHGLEAGEGILVISNSGKNCAPLEVAMYARKKGLFIISLSALAMSREIGSEHPDGRRLFEIADYVLDNGGIAGDAIVPLPEAGYRAGPSSTVAGAFLLNLLQLEVMDWMLSHGHVLPLVRSQNVPGGAEHNRQLGSALKHRMSKPLL